MAYKQPNSSKCNPAVHTANIFYATVSLIFFSFFFSFSSVDPEYKKFLESYSADDEKLTSTPETLLEEIEARNKELIGMEICVL